MADIKIPDDEKEISDHWLTMAQRFLAFCRSHAENCKMRTCNGAGLCMAEGLDPSPDKNVCSLPLQQGEVAQTVQLALFGMMLEEGLLNTPEDPAH